MGKLLILVGIILVIAGLIVQYAPNLPLGKLPGDIRIERENFSLYFPITTCLLISLLILILNYFWSKIR